MTRYTHGHAEAVVSVHAGRTAQSSAAYLLPHLEPGQRLLDVGCGPGSITLDLAQLLGPTGSVVGVDSAAPIVEAARAAGRARGDHRTQFEVADVLRLPFQDASFDVVHAHQVLQHLGEPVAALREMARVCRPGGLVAVREVDFGATTWWPPSKALQDWITLYTGLARANGAQPDAGRRLVDWAAQAGLVDVRAGASVWTYVSQEERQELARSWARRLRESLADQALAQGITAGELADIATGWTQWGQAEVGWFAYLNAELLARA